MIATFPLRIVHHREKSRVCILQMRLLESALLASLLKLVAFKRIQDEWLQKQFFSGYESRGWVNHYN